MDLLEALFKASTSPPASKLLAAVKPVTLEWLSVSHVHNLARCQTKRILPPLKLPRCTIFSATAVP